MEESDRGGERGDGVLGRAPGGPCRPRPEGSLAALEPGGRLAIVDIPGELGKKRDEYHEIHRIPVELVIQEAASAGLRLRSFNRDFARQPGGRRFYLVVFEKDVSDEAE